MDKTYEGTINKVVIVTKIPPLIKTAAIAIKKAVKAKGKKPQVVKAAKKMVIKSVEISKSRRLKIASDTGKILGFYNTLVTRINSGTPAPKTGYSGMVGKNKNRYSILVYASKVVPVLSYRSMV